MQPVETLIVTTRYEQIAEQIRQQIDNKTFAVEDRLPSVRAMARQMQVSVSTVIAAYSTLENQGIIEVRPNRGTTLSTRTVPASWFRTAPQLDRLPRSRKSPSQWASAKLSCAT